MIFTFIFAVAANQPPQAIPLNREEWISSQDYPPRAMLSRQEGKVTIFVEVNDAGRPANCSVEKTSGYEELDKQTCALIMSRAKFDKVESSNNLRPYRASFAWRIPNDPQNGVGAVGCSSDTLMNLFPQIDANHDGRLSIDEWVSFYDGVTRGALKKNPSLMAAIRAGFSEKDPNKDGFLTKQEIEDVFAKSCAG